MRKPFIAGNWKMYTNSESAEALATSLVKAKPDPRVTVAICPPFVYLSRVAAAIKGSNILLGAQNLYPEKEGAFTGEVSPAMLKDVGCRFVIVGHSERRHKLGESDAFISRKVHAGLDVGLDVILCVGETLEEREGNRTEQVLNTQISAGLAGLTATTLARVVVAYEPVWAIGTGRNATPEQAQQAHAFLRGRVREMYGEKGADGLLIQYGGSVKPDNAVSLLSQPDVDGALVGGASLQAEPFLAIVKAGLAKQPG